jgi:serine/threonine protein kinase
MPLEPNTLLKDRYRIIEELGRGGMGAVYRGIDESLEIEVAVKENTIVRAAAERQFKREATLLASLRHAHLPRVSDHFVIKDQGQYLVMDFIQGVNAQEHMKQIEGPLPEADVLRWAYEVLDALSYLHSRTPPVLHRDIKPGNIKITPDGRAVLVDFGLAKARDPDQPTTVGAKAYTPGFAPPEQYGQERTSIQTDIYSLGATLYMLLTRQRPTDSIERVTGKELIPIRSLNPDVTDHVAESIEKALELRQEDRFESAKAFTDSLKGKFERAIASTMVPAAETVVTAKPKKRSPIVPIVIGGLILLGAGTGAVLLLTGALSSSAPDPTDVPVATEQMQPTTVVPSTEAPPTEPVEVIVPSTETAAPEPTITLSPTPAGTPIGGGLGEIAFVSERDGLPQIYLVKVQDSEVRQLTAIDDGACQPAWSDDGQYLLFTSPCREKKDTYPGASIFRIKVDGSDLQPVFSHQGGAFDPAWNAAGMAFTVLEEGQPRIWVAGPEGANPGKITIGRSADRQPGWSPDGERLLFLNTSRAGSPVIFWMFPDGTFAGSNPDQITRDKAAGSADWSPLNNLVVYVSDSQIWVVPWDGNGFGETKITIKAGNDDPDWSPDGSWLTYESWFSAETHDIYIMTGSGAQQTQLTDHPAPDYHPAWRP